MIVPESKTPNRTKSDLINKGRDNGFVPQMIIELCVFQGFQLKLAKKQSKQLATAVVLWRFGDGNSDWG